MYLSIGSLGVPGAIEDSQRTAAFIEKHINAIDEIYVSLDTHHVSYLTLSCDDCKLHICVLLLWDIRC